MRGILKKIVFCVLFGACAFVVENAHAANVVFKNYSGKVVDKETGEPLFAVNIVIANGDGACSARSGTYCGCSTDVDGMFGNDTNSCNLSSNIVNLSFVGYKTKTNITLADSDNVIELEPDISILDAATIEEESCGNNEKFDDEQKKCVSLCEYFLKYPGSIIYDYPDEKIAQNVRDCCGASNTKWMGYKKGCECQQSGYKWENNTCVLKTTNNGAEPVVLTDEEACKKLGVNVAVWNGTACECVKADYIYSNGKCIEDPDVAQQRYDEKKQAYDEAKENEQSFANRTLTAATTAATGVGLMEAFQGRAEQKADAAADADMAAYIATMRCTYGNGQSVPAGMDPIELPGGNDETMMSLRSEYFALAQSLKSRKESLGMAPGIESEEILDKADMGLYGNENSGVANGSYSSLYRAQMLKNEEDQSKIDADKAKSEKRVKIGATVAGIGAAVGLAGNAIINTDWGKKLQSAVNDGAAGKETRALLKAEATALESLRKCLKTAGVKGTEDLSFENFFPSVLSVKSIDCKKDLQMVKGKNASDLFDDSTDVDDIYKTSSATTAFGDAIFSKMVGASSSSEKSIKNKLKTSIKAVQQKFKDAEKKDRESARDMGINIGQVADNVFGDGLRGMSYMFNGNYDDGTTFNLMNYYSK